MKTKKKRRHGGGARPLPADVRRSVAMMGMFRIAEAAEIDEMAAALNMKRGSLLYYATLHVVRQWKKKQHDPPR